ncbi:MAG TPA: TetR/AcrR family transcriptional regulator [Streptosporangiaceae bacterium]|jgi:AcrR family transcriptional regulator|nr:TetR/AcrR family transcriptional regulator [Streptosporangiaceae bacterium]
MPATLWSVRTSRDRLDSRTRAVLIAAARRAFSELGYARTTVADITARAEVSRATFYVYFGSKDDVFRVLTEQLRDEFLEAQLARSAGGADPVAVATAAVTEFVDVYAANLAFITVLEHQALTDPQVRALWLGIRERLLKRMIRFVGRLVADGVAHPVAPPDLAATAASGMAVRFAPLIAAQPGRRDQIMGHLIRLYLQTLGVDPGLSSRSAPPGPTELTEESS